MLKGYLIAAAYCLTLTGCTTLAQQELERLSDVVNQTESAANACTAKLDNEASFKPLQSKIYMGDDETPPISYLLNKSFPTKSELKLWQRRFEASRECKQITLQGALEANPRFHQVLLKCYNEEAILVSTLMSKKTNWGEINRKIADLRNRCSNEVSTVAIDIKSNLDAEHQAEIQRVSQAIQDASNRYQQQMQQQQQLYMPRMPVQTNCHAFGNSMNCTTY